MIRTVYPTRATLGVLAAAALLGATSLPVYAQEHPSMREPGSTQSFLNGGVGKEDQAHMHQIARQWPLRMSFSERKDNEFVADVQLTVTDHHGVPVLTLDHTGPMTYAKLPPGKYRITANLHGIAQTRNVTLDGRQGRDLHFHWTGDTPAS